MRFNILFHPYSFIVSLTLFVVLVLIIVLHCFCAMVKVFAISCEKIHISIRTAQEEGLTDVKCGPCPIKGFYQLWFLTLLVLIFSNDSPLESLDTSPGFQSQGWKSGTEEVSRMWSSSGSSQQSIIRDSNRKIRGPQNFIFNILVRNEERKLW